MRTALAANLSSFFPALHVLSDAVYMTQFFCIHIFLHAFHQVMYQSSPGAIVAFAAMVREWYGLGLLFQPFSISFRLGCFRRSYCAFMYVLLTFPFSASQEPQPLLAPFCLSLTSPFIVASTPSLLTASSVSATLFPSIAALLISLAIQPIPLSV